MLSKLAMLLGSIAITTAAPSPVPSGQPVQGAWVATDYKLNCIRDYCGYQFNIQGDQVEPPGPSFNLICYGIQGRSSNAGIPAVSQPCVNPDGSAQNDVYSSVFRDDSNANVLVTVEHNFFGDGGVSYKTTGIGDFDGNDPPNDFNVHQIKVEGVL